MGFVRARSTNEFDMYAKMKAKYPTWTKIMSSIAGSMEVNAALADFLVAIIEHTEDIFDSAPVRLETDYTQRSVGEVEFQSLKKGLFMRKSARSRMKSH